MLLSDRSTCPDVLIDRPWTAQRTISCAECLYPSNPADCLTRFGGKTLSRRDYLRQKKKEERKKKGGYELILTPFIYILKVGFPQEGYKFILLAELPSLRSCQALIRLLQPCEFLVPVAWMWFCGAGLTATAVAVPLAGSDIHNI